METMKRYRAAAGFKPQTSSRRRKQRDRGTTSSGSLAISCFQYPPNSIGGTWTCYGLIKNLTATPCRYFTKGDCKISDTRILPKEPIKLHLNTELRTHSIHALNRH